MSAMLKGTSSNQELLQVQNSLKNQLAASLRQYVQSQVHPSCALNLGRLEVTQTGLNEKSIQLSELLPLRDE